MPRTEKPDAAIRSNMDTTERPASDGCGPTAGSGDGPLGHFWTRGTSFAMAMAVANASAHVGAKRRARTSERADPGVGAFAGRRFSAQTLTDPLGHFWKCRPFLAATLEASSSEVDAKTSLRPPERDDPACRAPDYTACYDDAGVNDAMAEAFGFPPEWSAVTARDPDGAIVACFRHHRSAVNAEGRPVCEMIELMFSRREHRLPTRVRARRGVPFHAPWAARVIFGQPNLDGWTFEEGLSADEIEWRYGVALS